MWRIFYVFAALALASAAISLVGKLVGPSLLLVGNTTDTTRREVVIGNNVLAVPANMIRFERGRHDGEAEKLDLFMHWPDLDGYSTALRDAFSDVDGSRSIVFVQISPQIMSRDMSGRLEPIYRHLIEGPASNGPAGLQVYRLKRQAGYLDELLVVGQRSGQEPFVARCLSGPSARDSLAACERDVHFGDGLSAIYRFSDHLLGEWKSLDAAVTTRIAGLVQVSK